ncbi:P63C domain-containing protein [Novacetimonas hansenii]|uniref:P63C domain-containing protein n=1 Tax=Novacetimonas hansenii TaxID=436 RepID=A0AAW5EV69_NOVHA|nr:P63C domain-containing protein [Novacetimonas hansenii]MCJ8355220.1 P63C domain-containing protein [Novacetimonas hansenii]
MSDDKKMIDPIDAGFDEVAKAMVSSIKGGGAKTQIPVALYTGALPIGNVELDCAVLENGTRVLSERAVHRAFGSKRGGSHWKRMKENEGGANLPSFLSANNLAPFISTTLAHDLIEPIRYRTNGGGAVANGIKAELLPEICGVWLAARREGELHPSQDHLAQQAEVLMESFAKVGIIALVDEATGYQLDRKHDALRLLLNKYIADGLQKWLHTFPDTFFAELDRLYGNPKTSPKSRPQYYGSFINRYIYDPIENGYVKAELDKLNITDEGKRRARFHQWLTGDGRTILIRQIGRVEGVMEMCTDIEHFKKVAARQKTISVAPYLFDEMNRIID